MSALQKSISLHTAAVYLVRVSFEELPLWLCHILCTSDMAR